MGIQLLRTTIFMDELKQPAVSQFKTNFNFRLTEIGSGFQAELVAIYGKCRMNQPLHTRTVTALALHQKGIKESKLLGPLHH